MSPYINETSPCLESARETPQLLLSSPARNMKSSVPVMISVMGIFLITLFSFSQADEDPGQNVEENIRVAIKDGVNGDSITFWDIVDGVLQEQTMLSKARVCSRITRVHNKFNTDFLGGVTINHIECLRAFSHPLKYDANRLNYWADTHCGEWTVLGSGPAVPNGATWEDIFGQPPPQTQDVTYFYDDPPHGGFNRVDGTVS